MIEKNKTLEDVLEEIRDKLAEIEQALDDIETKYYESKED